MTPEHCPLNKREIEIIRHLAEGDTAKEISQRIGLTHNSVNMMVKAARRVVGAENSSHLVAVALRKGWIE